MIRAFSHKVQEERAHSILNTIYSVFLGLLSTYFFSQRIDSSGGLASVSFLVSSANVFTVSALSVYFIVDWITTNITISVKGDINHIVLVLLVLLISWLGGLVILAFAPSPHFYLLFAIYALIVPIWDLVVLRKLPLDKGTRSWALVLIGGTAFARFCLAAFFAAIVVVLWLVGHQQTSEAYRYFAWFLGAYVVLKCVRYLLYAQFAPVPVERP